MNPVIVPNAQWLAWLTALTAATGPLNGAKMHLFKTNINPDPTTPLASFIECDFTGYAAGAAIVWSAPFYNNVGTPVVTGPAVTFTVGAGPTILNTVYGWYLLSTAGTALLLARKLDSPVILTQASQALEVIPCYPTYISQ